MSEEAGKVVSRKSYEEVPAPEVTLITFSPSHSDKPATRFCGAGLRPTAFTKKIKPLQQSLHACSSVPVIGGTHCDGADFREPNSFVRGTVDGICPGGRRLSPATGERSDAQTLPLS